MRYNSCVSVINQLKQEIHTAANPEKAMFLTRFFKTGVGEYAEGDVFLGLTVPQSRIIAKKYVPSVTIDDAVSLLQSGIHEERLIALLLLITLYNKGDREEKREIYQLYLGNTKYINNWDLVDTSAEYIVGEWLYSKCHAEFISASKKILNQAAPGEPRLRRVQDDSIGVLKKLALSENLWERRIAMLSTFAFIKKGRHEEAFTIAEILLHDTEDLIHKAVGWLLREIGKRISEEVEESFLKKHYKTMPRTMLRYAIERFPEEKRKAYLSGKIANKN
jgi:3-methyladenine DNA glycosylase AlkD